MTNTAFLILFHLIWAGATHVIATKSKQKTVKYGNGKLEWLDVGTAIMMGFGLSCLAFATTASVVAAFDANPSATVIFIVGTGAVSLIAIRAR